MIFFIYYSIKATLLLAPLLISLKEFSYKITSYDKKIDRKTYLFHKFIYFLRHYQI